jgi:biotin carboxyl carrier protein
MIYKVTLNGKTYEVEVEKGEAMIKAEYEAALPQTPAPVSAPAPVQAAQVQTPAPAPVQVAASAAGDAAASALKAPLPGTINDVKAVEGQTVKAGDVLIILEAMKMENEIVADKDGKVGRIFVAKGASVQTGAPLLEII